LDLKKNWKVLDFSFFLGDIISRVGSGLFGQNHQALDPNRKSQFFDSSFNWKPGYNLSL